MTDLLEHALLVARSLPAEMQDDIARLMLDFVADDDGIELTAEDEEALRISEEEEARGEFVSDEEIRAIWAKHGL